MPGFTARAFFVPLRALVEIFGFTRSLARPLWARLKRSPVEQLILSGTPAVRRFVVKSLF
jgi:hypothetical protein